VADDAGLIWLKTGRPPPPHAARDLEESPMKRAAPDARMPPGTGSSRWRDTLDDGTRIVVRAVRDDDVERERAFIMGLSPQSRRFRFLGQIGQPSASLLHQLTHVDYVHDAAFAALVEGDAAERFLGVARFSTGADGTRCECAVAVLDDWQHRGVGSVLMRHLIEVARTRGIGTMHSYDAADNGAMADLAHCLGFERRIDHDDASMVVHTLRLAGTSP
jgi:GNAT superfamily N-acetyltransferase